MKSNKYRVWDTANKTYSDHVLIAQNGTIFLDLGDRVVPSLEPERYLVEFATDYPDEVGTMIYQGDLVRNTWDYVAEVTWYEFEDCCVNGHTWMLGHPDPAKSTLYDGLDEKLTIIGNVHEHPELLPQEQPRE